MRRANNWRLWILVGLACLGGCARQDADRLSRIAQLSSEKVDRATGGVRSKVSNGWQAARGSLGDTTLDSRVATRLKWDKALANSAIEAKTTAVGVVELKGSVIDEDQRRHALEIANATEGVTSVTDALVIAEKKEVPSAKE